MANWSLNKPQASVKFCKLDDKEERSWVWERCKKTTFLRNTSKSALIGFFEIRRQPKTGSQTTSVPMVFKNNNNNKSWLLGAKKQQREGCQQTLHCSFSVPKCHISCFYKEYVIRFPLHTHVWLVQFVSKRGGMYKSGPQHAFGCYLCKSNETKRITLEIHQALKLVSHMYPISCSSPDVLAGLHGMPVFTLSPDKCDRI